MNTFYKYALFAVLLTGTAITAQEQTWYDTAQESFEQFRDTVREQLPSYEEVKRALGLAQNQVPAQEIYDNVKEAYNADSWTELKSKLKELKDKGAILSTNAINALSKEIENLKEKGQELSSSVIQNILQLIDDWSGSSKAWLESLREEPATSTEKEGFILLGQDNDDFVFVDEE